MEIMIITDRTEIETIGSALQSSTSRGSRSGGWAPQRNETHRFGFPNVNWYRGIHPSYQLSNLIPFLAV